LPVKGGITGQVDALATVRTRVMEGLPLAHAWVSFRQFSSDLSRTTLSAGEAGRAPGSCHERLADVSEAQNAMRQKISLRCSIRPS
jgi:general secretion pathway protein F